MGRESEEMGVLWRGKMGFAVKEALIVMQTRLVCMTIKAHLCVKQGLFAMQVSLNCGVEAAFFAPKRHFDFCTETLLFA